MQEGVLRLRHVMLHLHLLGDEGGPRSALVIPDLVLLGVADAPAVASTAREEGEPGKGSTQWGIPTLAPHLTVGDDIQSERLLQGDRLTHSAVLSGA
jgi:hypothetical protein